MIQKVMRSKKDNMRRERSWKVKEKRINDILRKSIKEKSNDLDIS